MDTGELEHITVQIDELPLRCVLARLNLKDKLRKIREMLEQNTKVKMDDEFSFAKKIDNALAEIAKQDEENMKLEDIIEVIIGGKILYLKPEFDKKKFLNHKYRLDYGCTVTDLGALGKAFKRAFIMEDYEMIEFDGFQKNKIEIEPNDNWIVKTNSYLTVETNLQDFAELGVPIENIKKSNKYTCECIECSKASLKFIKLEATEDFINEVNKVLESKDPRKFGNITKDFGQFIPKEVILGGRVLFNAQNEYTKEKKNANGSGPLIVRERLAALFKNLIKNDSKYEGFKLVGGKQFCSNSFDEQVWIESLKVLRNWDCIKFKDPISIFQPLSKDLRRQILTLVGKKILYTNTDDYPYNVIQRGIPQIFELKVPENILDILRNEDAECNIFATVVCTKKAKGDIFNCQVLWPPNEDPNLIIHCIQKEFKKRECKLNIRLMIIGYDINFNFNGPTMNVQKHEFNASDCQTDSKLDLNYDSSVICFGIPVLRKLDSSNNSLAIGHHFYKDEENKSIGLYTFVYDLKENHYVNLPDFTFYILIISNNPNSGTLPFKRRRYKINFTKSNPLPKFTSLYSTGKDNCDPIFLKQRINKIKIGCIATNCSQDNCNCKNNTLKKSNKELRKHLEYAYFDPESRS